MTINNDTPVEGMFHEDGRALTRGDLLALQAVDLTAIRDRITEVVTAFEAGTLTPPEVQQGALFLAQHLVSYTANVAARLAQHDLAQVYAAPMPDSITIPDSLPDDFA